MNKNIGLLNARLKLLEKILNNLKYSDDIIKSIEINGAINELKFLIEYINNNEKEYNYE